MLIPGGQPGHLHVTNVTFAPGTRTVWHTHPFGQMLVASTGVGPGAAGRRARAGALSGRQRLDCRGRAPLGTGGPGPAVRPPLHSASGCRGRVGHLAGAGERG
ncbi:MAG: hypothetical protein WKG07_12090 [Hymenobacter sp.]